MDKSSYSLTINADQPDLNYWHDIWHYRDLFFILAFRDVSIRYKQAVFGILWAVLRPLLTMIIFVFVFGKVANMSPEGEMPYPVFVFAGLLPWTFFSSALTDSSNSLVGNSNLVSKVYFPRVLIPLSSIFVSLVDFLISFFLMALLIWHYDVFPDWKIIFMPLFMFLNFLLVIGIGLFVSSLNVKYRDFKFVVPFIVQLGLYVSPVGYSSTAIPEKYQFLYYLNPMATIIDGFRWSLSSGTTRMNFSYLAVTCLVILFVITIGILYFRKTEKHFADVI